MTQGLDYSAARLAGAAIKQAGYDFVIRYVGTPGRTKNITSFEYQDLVAAGVAVALVYENVAEDALGGFAAGVASAHRARIDADTFGFPADRPIYFAVDWVATAAQMPAVMAYLDGAASVLGHADVGVYGFEATIRAAMSGFYAAWFWQCGARSALVPGVHLYQHNNDNTTVSGITCDVNDALAPDFGQNTGGSMTTLDDSKRSQYVNPAGVQSDYTAPLAQFILNADNSAYTVWQLLAGEQRIAMPDGGKRNAFDALSDITSRLMAQSAQLTAIQGALTKEEADLLAAVKGLSAGAVDVQALAAVLVPLLPASVTVDQITAAFAAKLGATK